VANSTAGEATVADEELDVISGEHPTRPRRATGASLGALVLVGAAVAAVLFLHAARPDVHPLRNVMSAYANGNDGLAMTAAFYALGLAAVLLGLRLKQAVGGSRGGRLVGPTLALGGIGLVVAGIFEVGQPLAPESTAEVVHSNSAIAAFGLITTSLVLFAFACRSDWRWRSIRWPAAVLAVLTTTAAAATMVARQLGSSGGIQRLLAAGVLLWLVLTACHLRSRAFRSA
jgi:hypothetical protein